MSLYNIMNGYSPACILVLPMLGRRYDEYPRFRDCFVTGDGNIGVYTRVGGGNRNTGYGEDALYSDPHFVKTYDDVYDNTYATYEFRVPDKWKDDFDKVVLGKLDEISDEYVDVVKSQYPLLAEKGVIDAIFCRTT